MLSPLLESISIPFVVVQSQTGLIHKLEFLSTFQGNCILILFYGILLDYFQTEYFPSNMTFSLERLLLINLLYAFPIIFSNCHSSFFYFLVKQIGVKIMIPL